MGHSTPKKSFYRVEQEAPLDLSYYPSTPQAPVTVDVCPNAPKKVIPYEEVNCDLDATCDDDVTIPYEIPYEDTFPMIKDEEGDAPLLMDLSATLPMGFPDDSFQAVIQMMGEPYRLGGEDCICWDTRPWDERQGQLMCTCGAPE